MAGLYKIIDHPADTGIGIEADSLEELFVLAAEGLVATAITKPELIERKISKKIIVQGVDLKELMVNFLSEFLFYIDTEGLIFSDFKVNIEKKDNGYGLEAFVSGEQFNVFRHGSNTDIKAITYHQMKIEEKENKWQARIIFDI